MENPTQNTSSFYYTIVAPENIRSNTDFTLNLTIHDAKCEFKEAIIARVSIEDEHEKAGCKYKNTINRDVTMKPNDTVIATIPLGDLSIHSKYKLVVIGISGITMEHEAKLYLNTLNHVILIQTDKAIYKPKDCIKYRVLVLDSELKAAAINNKELSICFTDPRGNVLKKLNGVNTNRGVFSDEYELSDVPILGDWKIRTAVGKQEETKTIKVGEYVLPKFEVLVKCADELSIVDENVRIVIDAKYTHGQPMKGTAIVSVSDEDSYTIVKKTVVLCGPETIEFNIRNELMFYRGDIDFNVKSYEMKAEITETLTGLTKTIEKTIDVCNDAYEITTNLCDATLKQDSTANVTISVRHRNGAKIILGRRKKMITVYKEWINGLEKHTVETDHELNDNGDARFKMNIAKNETVFKLKVKYCEQISNLGRFYPRSEKEVIPKRKLISESFELRSIVLTKKCSINKVIEIEVISNYKCPSYTYIVVGRGRILDTKTIWPEFDKSERSKYVHKFSILPNFEYAPTATVIVYYLRDKLIVSDTSSIYLRDDFKNFIELDVAPGIAKPGQIIDLNIKSSPNSYVGLLGIDKSLLLLESGNDLTSYEIWKSLESLGPPYYDWRHFWQHFVERGLITFSNIVSPFPGYPRLRGGGDGRIPSRGPPVIRKEFPETWIWELIEDKSSEGTISLKKKVPDSLTTWVLTGFSIDPINGLAITKQPFELCVQQQFHISLNLPYSVKRGEIISIPCSIFNYTPNDIEAEVTLENEHNEFEFIDSAGNDRLPPKMAKLHFRKKKLTLRSGDASNALFVIRPNKVGLISLKVSAISTTGNDCVIKTLNVECEGVPQFINEVVYIDLRDKSNIDPIDLTIKIPKIALPDSTRIEITCVGDLLGGTIKNLQQLIRLPYGCGEQNMLNFVPNIVVLEYLSNTHQLTTEIELRAKKYMEIGYQRELSYKHKDGSFSAFGEYDKSGSTWLTAFVARSFRQATAHITVQDDIIDNALKWLSDAQAKDGSFIEKGSIFQKEMQSGSSNGVALTAYVLTAFLVNKNSNNEYKTVINKAIKSIVKSVRNCFDVYALAVSAYALQKADHDSKNVVIKRLKELAKSKGNLKWWDKSLESQNSHNKQSTTLSVEITAYALLTLQLNDQNSECLPILRWLLNQRNDQGGFEGTQDTIVGIEALAKFASKIATKENDVKIEISTPNNTKFNFEINQENSLVLQSQKLTPDVKNVRVNATGKGFALLELGYRYNINAPEKEAAFSLKPVVDLINKDHIRLQITTAYLPPKGKDSVKQSNMVVMEIALPSGFVINSELLNELKSTLSLVKRIETKNNDTLVILYFDHLTSVPVTMKIDGFREHLVEEPKPASILVYDYYDSALSAREFYSL